MTKLPPAKISVSTALAIGATVLALASATAHAAPARPPLPKQLGGEAIVSERWTLPQVVQPGARPVTSAGREGPNTCSFPIRMFGYHHQTVTRHANGDLGLHIIRIVTYQSLDGRNTIFETDNFKVLIPHAHPKRDWTIIGRYGEWHLNAKLVWLETGKLTGSPSPHGGVNVTDPHPTALSAPPDLCKELAS